MSNNTTSSRFSKIKDHLDDLRYMNEDAPHRLWCECLIVLNELSMDPLVAEPYDIEFGEDTCEYENGEYTMSVLTIQWPEIEIMIAYHDTESMADYPIGCSTYGLFKNDFVQVLAIEDTTEAITFVKQHAMGKPFQLDTSGYIAFNV